MFLSRLSALAPARARAGRSLAALAVAVVLLSACASGPTADPTADWSPNRLHAEAVAERERGNFERAITLFERLEGRAAGTLLAQQAQLEKAFAHYRAGEQAQAIATLDRFMRLHPASPALDYALYLKGLVNFQDNLGFLGFLANVDLSERDQRAARQSFEAFKELVDRFPESRYAPDARLRLAHIVNSLAQSEVNVARFYFSRGAYVAALNRAQVAITDFQGVPAAEEALYIKYRSYQALGMNDLAADARRVLALNFPQSAFLGQGAAPERAPWWRLW
ncbi:MAG: outer membrane protein assembly factor BamD [Serpentinimonas sp.]|nr:MAG: competence protein ComL [Comamonadaceae bacterium BICA1-1]MDO9612543.1 outer membrane protein assembly factor BamD [Serpentinimonas sp.]